MKKSARELSAILRAAGQVEEARATLETFPDYGRHRDVLKSIADDLAAEAVAGRVRIANDVEQNYGHSS